MPSNCAEIETRINQAIDHLTKNPCTKVARAAREFNVPVQRLRRRLQGVSSASDVRGLHTRRLTAEQDLALIIYLRKLISFGLNPRLNVIKSAAYKLLMQDASESSPPPPLSHAWTTRWLQRHPEFQKIKRKPRAAVRKNAENPDVIKRHFDQFAMAQEEYGISPDDTWNFDETGFRLSIARADWVIGLLELINGQKQKQQAWSKCPDNRESLTAIECINGTGLSISSFLIMTGTMIMNFWINNDLNDDVLLSTADTGYSNDWLSLEWLKHFDKHSAKTQKGAYRLLLMDGYGSHHTCEFIEYCDKAKIIPFGLPAHTTHLLQPLDVVVFQPLKHWHAEAVKEAMAHGDETFTKVEFLNAFNSFRKKAFKKFIILSAWKAVGLFPYNPFVVLRKLINVDTAEIEPSTLIHSDYDFDYAADTPKGLIQLGVAQYEMERVYPDSRIFHKFAKGALATARAGRLIEEQLATTKAAENARKVRANQGKKSVQRGGVIRVGDCRRMVTDRKDEEDRLKQEREMRVMGQQRKRWKPVMRELVKKIPYYIDGHSYGLSSI
jgi:hypothetical protein